MAMITVTAGEGRETPIPTSIATGPGGTMIRLKPRPAKGLEIDGEVYEVTLDDSHHYVFRALRNGDLVIVKPKAPASPAKE